MVCTTAATRHSLVDVCNYSSIGAGHVWQRQQRCRCHKEESRPKEPQVHDELTPQRMSQFTKVPRRALFVFSSGKTDAVRVSFPGRVLASAEPVLANERPLPKGAAPLAIAEGGFRLPMGPFALETVRVRHALPRR